MPDSSSMPCVVVRGLCVEYVVAGRAHRAVNRVSFDIPRGRTLALVGESGSGKTSIGKALLHLTPYTAETVEIAGAQVPAMSAAALRAFRRRAQMVFQNAGGSLTPTMSITTLLRDTVTCLGVRPAEGMDAFIDALLARVGLDKSLASRFPHELSGGQRQRVAIARALIPSPQFLILDEPLSALDVPAQCSMLDLLAALLKDADLTILLITHQLEAAARLADQVAVLHDGEIVELGATAEVLSHPGHPHTRRLCAAWPSLLPRPRAADSAAPA